MADVFDDFLWNREDAAWERLQRAGSAAIRDGDLALARQRIGNALALAREHFPTGDPRLAASLAANAWLQRPQAPDRAASLFDDALAHWAQAETWLAHQPPPERRARSSSFHLRLESRHPGAYREHRAAEIASRLADGRALTEALRDGRRPQDLVHGDQNLVYGEKSAASARASDTHGKIGAALDLLLTCFR